MSAGDMWTHSDYISLLNVFATIAMGIAIVIATYLGPIMATREADKRHQMTLIREKRMHVFRLMMGHRIDVAKTEFISGLNLVPIEFSECPDVIDAFHKFLNAHEPSSNKDANIRKLRENAVIKLLNSMGDVLGYKLDQLDLMDQVYLPQRIADNEFRDQQILDFLYKVSQHKEAISIFNLYPEALLTPGEDGKTSLRVSIQTPHLNETKQ